MFALEIRDHIMIAHSLPDPFFGPAQGLHGATFTVDATFFAQDLGAKAVVVDIGRASETLKSILSTLNYRNLDDITEFSGRLTTTEFLCRYIFDRLASAVSVGETGPGSERVTKLRVTLEESHIARAWYEGPVPR